MLPPGTEVVDRLLREDVPYGDLTSRLLGMEEIPARMTCVSRSPITVAGMPLVRALCERVGARVVRTVGSGTSVAAGEQILHVEGSAGALHLAWKVSVNVLESACGIATRTRSMVDAARSVAPAVEVFTTRKVMPGTKELATEAILAGGALPHRLGLSETVLVFDQHTRFVGGIDGLVKMLPRLRERAREKVVLVEVDNLEDALRVARAGAGGVQFEKFAVADLARAVAEVRRVAPQAALVAAGGINDQNAAAYASTGVDALATSWMYSGPVADLGVVIEPVD